MRHKYARRRQLFATRMKEFLARQAPGQRLHLDGPGTTSLAAWFLGPRAENQALFAELVGEAVKACCDDRNTLYPNDPQYVTSSRMGRDYEDSVRAMTEEYRKLLDNLKGSVPFFSYRYQAHMNWDLTMPGMLGYFSAMLYNQNNVALEASPVTAGLERCVGDDLCRMLGFDTSDASDPRPWGHITCDGSVANLEAMWASRNLKYFALSLKAAIKHEKLLAPAREMTVQRCDGTQGLLIEQDAWTLMNLEVDVVLDLPSQIQEMCQITSDQFSSALDPYLLQSQGIDEFLRKHARGVAAPVILGPATKHYSWPKNAALTGIGKNHFIDIHVDGDARMDMEFLDEKLTDCLNNKWPVVMVVVVLGSTEESAVDPLADVVALRNSYRAKGLEFAIHVDAAWGGYFASILRDPEKGGGLPSRDRSLQVTPILELSPYVTRQYRAIPEADSVTIDPHKAGYVPYPAGGLCYRNSAMRNLVAFLAPEVYHGSDVDSDMGVYGVEGSKPGAAAAGVYLSHRVVRPDRSGYGRILGQALFNSKRFYAAVITMAEETDNFFVVPVQQIPAEREGGSHGEIEQQLAFIKERIVMKQNNDLLVDHEAMQLLKRLGSDQIIITYGFNFMRDGVPNTDPALANAFMHEIFERLSFPQQEEGGGDENPPIIVTTSEFDPDEYGEEFVATYMRRLKLNCEAPVTMHFISSTTMCPWLTATEEGNFIPTLIDGFRKVVRDILRSGKY